ncbi:SURF1 family protein [Roseomonas sp. PWR1]|uniref:SURF1-like protein n=1 Tax=Roseomonas nitratireducens TaxID=2820810 RepID=A0ABS4AYD2_9PROT|nr:SURF1 family protein [Neoroseomonas nitratireducens]MBP0466383.1 SURF1 family protein [Neoroseomonas nitratireducens]
MRRLILPLAVTLPALVILLGLGTWQAERLGWKRDILARIDAAEAAPPVPLPAAPTPFTKVEAAGRFDHAREALVGLEVRGNHLGARLVVPLLRDGAAPLLVDRGWVPLDRAGAIDRPEGDVRVAGWVREAERAGWFSATDDAAGRRFYSFDPAAIGAALGLPGAAPFALVALGDARGLPAPDRAMPRPRNNHLGYAITWYGLAAALAGVFLVWARRRLKE